MTIRQLVQRTIGPIFAQTSAMIAAFRRHRDSTRRSDMVMAIRDMVYGLTRGFSLFVCERDARELGSVHRSAK